MKGTTIKPSDLNAYKALSNYERDQLRVEWEEWTKRFPLLSNVMRGTNLTDTKDWVCKLSKIERILG